MVAERVNEKILPLERSSLLHAVSRITGIIKQEVRREYSSCQDKPASLYCKVTTQHPTTPQ